MSRSGFLRAFHYSRGSCTHRLGSQSDDLSVVLDGHFDLIGSDVGECRRLNDQAYGRYDDGGEAPVLRRWNVAFGHVPISGHLSRHESINA
jgi:hypothetical protein